ncbi:MAG TPA: tripartite tricarboxylate transporter substrate binding protein [Burkholderiales bacterium]|nr:tripartite tricarboxylate transporter substrate binding protein [Burkholderiales bacterium]
MNSCRLAALSIAAALLAPVASAAQAYPTKPIRLIVPWPPAGPSDILARALSVKLAEPLKQPIVIDNRAGASGIIGAEIASKAPADGYTMLVDNVTGHAINPSVYRKLPYHPLRDFTPVALMASVNNVLVVHPSTPAASIKDIIAAAKAKPGLAYASFGAGTTAHLAAELFKGRAGIDLVHVPYKGGAPALADLMGGRVYMMFATMPSAAEHVKAGKLKAIATTGAKRSVVTPEVPTAIESGLPGFEATNWYGALFPTKSPASTIERMNREINAVMNDPPTRQRLVQVGFEVATGTPGEFAQILNAETAKWAKVVKQAGIQLDF